MPPGPVLASLPPSPRVVEVGVGGRFEALLAAGRRRPRARLVAVDADPAALEGAPEGVSVHVDDVRSPRVSPYRGADLLLARRPPVELQPAIARLARRLSAPLAIRALKDEWAPLDAILGPRRPLETREPWRWWPGEPGRADDAAEQPCRKL